MSVRLSIFTHFYILTLTIKSYPVANLSIGDGGTYFKTPSIIFIYIFDELL